MGVLISGGLSELQPVDRDNTVNAVLVDFRFSESLDDSVKENEHGSRRIITGSL